MAWFQWFQSIVRILSAISTALETVGAKTGVAPDHPQTVNEIVNHLTPGQPNSPHLS
jgi:hypothetical protein